MGGWLYEHENITNSVKVGAGAELGKSLDSLDKNSFQRFTCISVATTDKDFKEPIAKHLITKFH